jgi:hypothetical protein
MRTLTAFLAACLSTFFLAQPASSLEPVGDEFQISTYTSCNQDTSAAAPLSGGNFVVVWESGSASVEQDGSLTGVFGQRFEADGTRIGTEFRVNVYTTDTQEDPGVASLPDGSFVVVWDGDVQDGSEEGVFARRFAANGSPGEEFQVNTYTTDLQTYPHIGRAGNGFVVVWESFYQDGDFVGVVGRRLDATGSPAGSEFVVNTYTEGQQRKPRVAGNAAGNFVVVWASGPVSGSGGQDGSEGGIFGQRFAANGSKAGTEFQVNVYTTGGQVVPDVVMADDGRFIVVWEGRRDLTDIGPDEVNARRYDADGQPIGTEFLVNQYYTAFEEDVAISKTADGTFLVAWETENGGEVGSDDSGESIVARQLDTDGELVGTEFQVNTYSLEDQDGPAVTGLSTGGFVVAWTSYEQDGELNGVFGQILGGDVLCGDATGDGSRSASDALQTLKTAVGSSSCPLCVCDVNDSGGINATDALIDLRAAVGQPVTLTCPAC